MKKSGQAVALAAMVSVAVLGGCTSYSAASASEYPDGEYFGTSKPDRDGASGEIRFTLEGGKVVQASFMIVDADGTIRDENYGKGAGGEIVDEEFYRLGQNALAAEAEYVTQFEETSDQHEVDAIAGASLSYRHFMSAIDNALADVDAGIES